MGVRWASRVKDGAAVVHQAGSGQVPMMMLVVACVAADGFATVVLSLLVNFGSNVIGCDQTRPDRGGIFGTQMPSRLGSLGPSPAAQVAGRQTGRQAGSVDQFGI